MTSTPSSRTRHSVLFAFVALLLSGAVMVFLALENRKALLRLGDERLRAVPLPVVGSLAGRNALDGSEWSPDNKSTRPGLLFGISEVSDTTHIGYWSELASRLSTLSPGFELVGLCLSRSGCQQTHPADFGITLLSAMDPAMVHAVALSARGGQAFLLRGSHVVGVQELSDLDTLTQRLWAFSRRAHGSDDR